MKRRDLLCAAAAASLSAAVRAQAAAPRVVIVGGGFAGAGCARALKQADARIEITLVEPDAQFHACPMSNGVVVGLRGMDRQRFGYAGLRREGIAVAALAAVGVDATARRITLSDGTRLDYDRLVLAPGIQIRWDAVQGYDAAAARVMPHAWQAGEQTLLLRRQLKEMRDGGLVVITAPPGPSRCPPAPYERASLIAWYLKARKPRSKVLVLDAKDAFPKQALFEAAWKERYAGLIERVPLSSGGAVVAVEPATRTVITDFERYPAAVASVMAPQKAAPIAVAAGLVDASGWCPVDPMTFESRQQSGVHVIGDAAIGGAMPKSAFGAHAQAAVCAQAVAALLAGRDVPTSDMINACFSLVAPDYGISVSGIYHARNGEIVEAPGTASTSAGAAPARARMLEAQRAEAVFQSLTRDTFGQAAS